MEFWEMYGIKDEYVGQTLESINRSYKLIFYIDLTPNTEWEYYYNNGFDFVFYLK